MFGSATGFEPVTDDTDEFSVFRLAASLIAAVAALSLPKDLWPDLAPDVTAVLSRVTRRTQSSSSSSVAIPAIQYFQRNQTYYFSIGYITVKSSFLLPSPPDPVMRMRARI